MAIRVCEVTDTIFETHLRMVSVTFYLFHYRQLVCNPTG